MASESGAEAAAALAADAAAAPVTAGVTVAAVLPSEGAIGRSRPLGTDDTRLTAGFWAERARINRENTIPAGFEQLRAAGTLHNFSLAASAAREGYRALGIMFEKPFPFLDSDVYKWLEGAGWELARERDRGIAAMADEAIALIQAAQMPDGYLNTFVQVLAPGNQYRDLAWGHELYCYGHLIQAAVAWHRGLGDDRLLLVAERAAASMARELGPTGREAIDGHPEIEMALVELFRVTRNRSYLELAAAFIERRGHGSIGIGRFGRAYWQDHLPVSEAPEVVGHAVRQLYLDSGAVDVAVELGDQQLLDAVHRRWRAMVESKTYLTGALGSRHRDEAFGDPFELPPDQAYAETCAAIASVMLAWRLLLATGDPACADLIERTMLNGVLPSLSRDGTEFFYVNPLQRRTHRTWEEPGDTERTTWYACACCPPNLMRSIGSWQQLLATTDDGGVQLHQYAAAEIRAGAVRLAVETGYPWDGEVRVTVVETPAEPWTLTFRVPEWAVEAVLRDGDRVLRSANPGDRSIAERRAWRPGASVTLGLGITARVTRPDPRVDAIRGTVALERGPLVYALESADMPPGVEVEDVRVAADAAPADVARPDLGADVIGLSLPGAANGARIDVAAIPYFAWANRGLAGMRVWIPRTDA